MAKLLEFLDRHTARNLFRSSHLKLSFSFDQFVVRLLGNTLHDFCENVLFTMHYSFSSAYVLHYGGEKLNLSNFQK